MNQSISPEYILHLPSIESNEVISPGYCIFALKMFSSGNSFINKGICHILQ